MLLANQPPFLECEHTFNSKSELFRWQLSVDIGKNSVGQVVSCMCNRGYDCKTSFEGGDGSRHEP